MQTFHSFKEAFTWWLENVYPNLPIDEKREWYKVKYDFLHRSNVSDTKIQEILKRYGNLKITLEYENNFK